MTYPNTKAVVYTHDAASNRRTLTHPRGVTFTYDYDDASRLTRITHRRAGAVTFNIISYGYDASGPAGAEAGIVTWEYVYSLFWVAAGLFWLSGLKEWASLYRLGDCHLRRVLHFRRVFKISGPGSSLDSGAGGRRLVPHRRRPATGLRISRKARLTDA